MKIILRVDSSLIIGSGHVMRCLTLGDALKKIGHDIEFVCRDYPSNMIDFIRQKGFHVGILEFEDKEAYRQQVVSDDYSKWLWVNQEQDALDVKDIIQNQTVSWLILDHYGLDIQWEQALRPYAKRIMVIDDLANRKHDCDILLDQNYYLDLEHRYDDLVSNTCIKLLGPQYTLIRSDFLKVREKRKALGKFEPHAIKNILISMGGADLRNITEHVIHALLKMPAVETYHIDVIVGKINPHQETIKKICDQHVFLHYHCQPDCYMDLLVQADLAIAAGGSSTYERILILLPTITFVIADNQYQLVKDIEIFGAHYGMSEEKTIDFGDVIAYIQNNMRDYRSKMAMLVDGLGVERVVGMMCDEH